MWHLWTYKKALYKHVFGVCWFLSQPNPLESVYTPHNDTSNLFLLLHTGEVLGTAFNLIPASVSALKFPAHGKVEAWTPHLQLLTRCAWSPKVKVVYEPQILAPRLWYQQPCHTALHPGCKRSSVLCTHWKSSSVLQNSNISLRKLRWRLYGFKILSASRLWPNSATLTALTIVGSTRDNALHYSQGTPWSWAVLCVALLICPFPDRLVFTKPVPWTFSLENILTWWLEITNWHSFF